MAPVVLWIVLALVVAALVILVAGVAGGRSGGSQGFVTDLRGGLRREHGRVGGFLTDARKELTDAAEVEAGGVEEIFSLGEPPERDYVRPGEIAGSIGRATSRALRTSSRAGRR